MKGRIKSCLWFVLSPHVFKGRSLEKDRNFQCLFVSIISEGTWLTVNMDRAPNYQLPIQKSSALLPCQMLVKDMANILATHI